MPSLAVVTAPRAFEWYDDHALHVVVSRLIERGITAEAVPWYDESVDWRHFDAALVRSPWDLYWHLAEFKRWLARIAERVPLANPAPVLHWNLEKRYLTDLARAGVPTVPTTVIEPGEPFDAPRVEFVVKPATSGAALNTARYHPDEGARARAHVARIHDEGMAALAQPYLTSVDTDGERGLVFFGGEFSHAIRKTALLKPGEAPDAKRVAHPNLQPYAPTDEELAVARSALTAVPGASAGLVYARVDLIRWNGTPTVIELELLDPDLFLQTSEGAFDRYIDAIAAWVRKLGTLHACR